MKSPQGALLRFEYRLARELGMTHKQLMESINMDELHHWLAMERVEPIDNNWTMNANLLALLMTFMGKKTYTAGDIYSWLREPRRPQTDEEALASLRLWAIQQNAIHAAKGGS